MRFPYKIAVLAYLLGLEFLAAGCGLETPVAPAVNENNVPAAGQTIVLLVAPPAAATNLPTRTPIPTLVGTPTATATRIRQYATLDEFWKGQAE
jgi:hypothetical protein